MACTYAASQSNDVHHSFANPPMISSRDGKLHVDLVAAPATYTIGAHVFQGMLYNGQYVPPVWRLRSGDTLTVTLHNQLSEETNLHFHGIDVSPLNNGDNVFVHIAPGGTFSYEVKIPEMPRPIQMDSLILGPGQRVSVVVVGGNAGRYPFKSVEFKVRRSPASTAGSGSGHSCVGRPASRHRYCKSKCPFAAREWSSVC
jgi:FtsP/CotA-like multicopper oxidase with cupredoxin domain